MEVKIDTDISKWNGVITRIEQIAPKIMLNVGYLILFPNIKYEIDKLIKAGGSSNPKYSWGYWERRRGDKFTYRKGKAVNFTNGWKASGVVRYPIHPLSYKARSKRKIPTAGQFALIDTGDLLRSFKVVSSFSGLGYASLVIGSSSFKLDYHERQFKYRRVISQPVFDIFISNQALHERFFIAVGKELERI